MIGKLIDMALASWEQALTPVPKKFEYSAGMHAALAGMAEILRQLEMLRNNGGVRLEIGIRSAPSKDSEY
jgi:hypothetical protein